MSGAGFPGSDVGSSASEMPPMVRPPQPRPHRPTFPRDEHTVTQPLPFERPHRRGARSCRAGATALDGAARPDRSADAGLPGARAR